MNFFEHQRWAQQRTRILIFYFALAVVLIVGVTTFGVVALLLIIQPDSLTPESLREVALGVALTTTILIFLASWGRWLTLRKGGSAVAEMLGGQLIVHSDSDPKRKQLLNVVEEMAIASGLTMPQVYLLPQEKSINAFAAGYTPNQAVVGFSQGCLDHLTRDELQGVVAHEFSHIVHGDMRLNTYLISVLFGIYAMTIAGRSFLRSLRFMRVSGGGRGGRGGGGGGAALFILGLMAFGLLLVIMGYIGVAFGQLIKATISRQREFLADASALQFTRNPLGIGGALKKIYDFSAFQGKVANIENHHAQEMSHMFISSPGKFALNRLLASHPPLAERISRIDKNLLNQPVYIPEKKTTEPEAPAETEASQTSSASQAAHPILTPLGQGQRLSPEQLLLTLGLMLPQRLEQAQRFLKGIPEKLLEACRDPLGSLAVVYALALEDRVELRPPQLEWLKQNESPHLKQMIEPTRGLVDQVDLSERLRLFDLALPTLKELNPARQRSLLQNLHRIMYLDQQLDHFQFVLFALLRRHLLGSSSPATQPLWPPNLAQMENEVSLVLSSLAHLAGETESHRADAFVAGAHVLKGHVNPRYRILTKAQGENLLWAIDRLRRLPPQKKELVTKALLSCALKHQPVLPQEQEMLRALLESIDAPAPSLDQPPT